MALSDSVTFVFNSVTFGWHDVTFGAENSVAITHPARSTQRCRRAPRQHRRHLRLIGKNEGLKTGSIFSPAAEAESGVEGHQIMLRLMICTTHVLIGGIAAF